MTQLLQQFTVIFDENKFLPLISKSTLQYSEKLLEGLLKSCLKLSRDAVYLCIQYGQLVVTQENPIDKKTRIATILQDGTYSFSEMIEEIVEHLDSEVLYG